VPNRDSILHSKGHLYQLRNDVPYPTSYSGSQGQVALSDVEAGEADRMIREMYARNRNGNGSGPGVSLRAGGSGASGALHQPWFIEVGLAGMSFPCR